MAEVQLIRWPILVVVIGILASHVLFVTPRWSTILGALGYPLSSASLIGSVFLGFLFNQLLPTAVGGDLIRAWQARRFGVPLAVAVHSVIIDRVTGVIFVAVGTIMLLPFVESTATQSSLLWSIGVILVVGTFGCLGLWTLNRLRPSSIPVIGAIQLVSLAASASMRTFVSNGRAVLIAMVFAGFGQAIAAAAIVLLANEVGVHLPLLDLIFVAFGAMLAAAVPISIAGWGIREGALVFLFGTFGIPPQTAFVISILFGACLLIAAAPGALTLLAPEMRSMPKATDF